ncbi:uncharacterized protein MONBRDRAFT_32755 [Monosiga brevicollis MX1]|uniref:Copper type II ascorbate-dependent monooxygenase C-terminal domain-containing protein n=1 Tax=Monosiga brevicollis TaxID=81824 RepID=A9V1I8_MONBE|nr:uncharacterized protein MONBRDRAFT_32755 [Monosiga brevicollis MX1]EDQ88573.1 predicted protein [Monosiga brevicollis MX1]|eukprot:XP_001746677.1 hypothetical protein [Monosiga brevicollis MX1]
MAPRKKQHLLLLEEEERNCTDEDVFVDPEQLAHYPLMVQPLEKEEFQDVLFDSGDEEEAHILTIDAQPATAWTRPRRVGTVALVALGVLLLVIGVGFYQARKHQRPTEQPSGSTLGHALAVGDNLSTTSSPARTATPSPSVLDTATASTNSVVSTNSALVTTVTSTESELVDAGQLNLTFPPVSFPAHTSSNYFLFPCQAFDLSTAPVGHITAFELHSTHPELVHHSDVFLCTPAALARFHKSGCPTFSSIFTNGLCTALAFAYDKGAVKFHFPEGTGFAVGPGTQAPVLVMQIHYLIFEPPSSYVTDVSTMMLDTAPGLPEAPLFTVGLGDYNLRIPPLSSNFSYSFTCSASAQHFNLTQVLPVNVVGQSWLIRGAHLHAHEHATRIMLEAVNETESTRLVMEMNPYHGYGADQTFQALETPFQMEPNESLRTTCWFNNTGSSAIVYGVTTTTEMCGILVLATTIDGSTPVPATSTAGNLCMT